MSCLKAKHQECLHDCRLSGHSPNQEAKCDSVFHRLMSSPTSLSSVWATITSMPSMRVRSTPVTRCSSLLRSKRGAFLAAGFFVLAFCVAELEWEGMCQAGEVLLQSLVALGDSFLIDVVHVYLLLQHKQQFRTPVAFKAFGNLLLASMNPRITQRSQRQRIALASHDRPYDRLSGQSTYV